jgi:hypothetical protein
MHTIKKIFSNYGGIIVGSLYGLTMRLIFGNPFKIPGVEFTDLFSITFIWIVPVLIGIAPMMFATKEQLTSNTFRITRPVLAVLLFFLLAFWSGREDIVCIVIIAFPFLLAAAVSGYLFAKVMQHRKNNSVMMFSLFLIPFVSGFIEEKFPTPSQTYSVGNVVIVNATPEVIWKNIVRVKEINESEYEKGFFNYAGIPRPLYAELDEDTIGATRVGHFEGGLTFNETVTAWEKNKRVAFNITVIPSTIRQTIFDQHVLKGKHFTFLDASYTLERISDIQTKLTLSSTYRLDTRINSYSAIWGRILLSDFQGRLLGVIKKRCDEQK